MLHHLFGTLATASAAVLATAVSPIAPVALAGPYAPAAGQSGSEAIAFDDPLFVGWATGVANLTRGPQDIANPGGGLVNYGVPSDALGAAGSSTSQSILSLGDGGSITVTFDQPIVDGDGFDFAVFENSFSDTFLELALVEVSSNGSDFIRFDAVSLTPTDTQVGGFGALDTTNLDNLAGKYRVGYGTPFDLNELADASPLLNINAVTHVRLIDVVGSINPSLGTQDSLGNLINDPYATLFSSSGFDLDAVGVINVPEPTTALALACTGLLVTRRRKQTIN